MIEVRFLVGAQSERAQLCEPQARRCRGGVAEFSSRKISVTKRAGHILCPGAAWLRGGVAQISSKKLCVTKCEILFVSRRHVGAETGVDFLASSAS